MPHADAVLLDDRGRTVLRFERTLRHPPEKVWRALTELDDLRSWHPSPFEIEARAGGKVSYLPPYDAGLGEGSVSVYDPPRTLAYTWGEDELRWELEPHVEGCLLVVTHTFDDRLKAARDAAGWEICLEGLAASLDGVVLHRDRDGDGLPVRWHELNRTYENRFGIDPAQATKRPPGNGRPTRPCER